MEAMLISQSKDDFLLMWVFHLESLGSLGKL